MKIEISHDKQRCSPKFQKGKFYTNSKDMGLWYCWQDLGKDKLDLYLINLDTGRPQSYSVAAMIDPECYHEVTPGTNITLKF